MYIHCLHIYIYVYIYIGWMIIPHHVMSLEWWSLCLFRQRLVEIPGDTTHPLSRGGPIRRLCRRFGYGISYGINHKKSHRNWPSFFSLKYGHPQNFDTSIPSTGFAIHRFPFQNWPWNRHSKFDGWKLQAIMMRHLVLQGAGA